MCIRTRVLTRGSQEGQRRRKKEEDERRGWSGAALRAKEPQWLPEAAKDKEINSPLTSRTANE